jgi:hypothetical protein
MSDVITIATTRERAEALRTFLMDQPLSYTDNGQLVLGFLQDLERVPMLRDRECRHGVSIDWNCNGCSDEQLAADLTAAAAVPQADGDGGEQA